MKVVTYGLTRIRTSAVKTKKVFEVEGNLFSRPGPRVGVAAEAYAKLVHPELFR